MDVRVRRVIAEMQCHLESAVPVATLAERAGVSVSRFAHLFTAEVGISPARYLKLLRLERARQLLTTTTASVKAVALSVGIRDPSHFVRDYSAVYGETPHSYRRRLAESTIEDDFLHIAESANEQQNRLMNCPIG